MASICDTLGLVPVKGDVGVEIELEARSYLPEPEKFWRSEVDGSLRGRSIEYVMRRPVALNKVGECLDHLRELFLAHGTKVKYSERAGVHVHVNVGDKTTDQVITMALVYYCLENALVNYCGENRVGNHFCLRMEDADFVTEMLALAMQKRNLRFLDNEDIRYASLNFCSLFRYGSLEFRAMESQPDLSKIEEWCRILVAIRDYACQLDSAADLPFEISSKGPSGWARGILGDELFGLINHQDFDMGVMRSMRPIQHLFYMRKP